MDLSVVIPVFNERENIIPLCESLMPVLGGLRCSFEVIFVDDGSTDGTDAVLADVVERWDTTQVIQFRRNFGQSPALQAGFDHAQGEVIVTMDGDLQNDPSDIPLLLARLKEGFDIVSGFRAERKEGLIRRLPSVTANWLLRTMTGVALHDTGCTLKAYRKDALEAVRLYGEQHRFIPVLASQYGARITEIPVKHWQRRAGKSKYGLSRTHRVFLDILMLKFLLSYGTRPLQVFGAFGLGSFFLGILINLYLTIRKIQGHPLAERPLLLLGILLLILGVQFVSMGLLAEMLVRTYHETTRKATYMVAKILRSERKED